MKPLFKINDIVKLVAFNEIIISGKITNMRVLTNTLSNCFAKNDVTKYYYAIDGKGLHAEDVLEPATEYEYNDYLAELESVLEKYPF